MQYQKRGASAPAVSTPQATPTQDELKARLVAIRQEAQDLGRERERNSLAALQGHEGSKNTIGAIDVRRRTLAAEEETIESGLRALQQQAREARSFETHRDWPRRRAALAATVQQRRDQLAFNSPALKAQDFEFHLAHAEPLTVATELVEALVPRELHWRESSADGPAVERSMRAQRDLDQKRQREVRRVAELLVSQTEIPPLPDALERAIDKLARAREAAAASAAAATRHSVVRPRVVT